MKNKKIIALGGMYCAVGLVARTFMRIIVVSILMDRYEVRTLWFKSDR